MRSDSRWGWGQNSGLTNEVSIPFLTVEATPMRGACVITEVAGHDVKNHDVRDTGSK